MSNQCVNGHTPSLVGKTNKWKEGYYSGTCRKGYTAIYRCVVCGFRWREEKSFHDAFVSWPYIGWTWVEE